MGTLRDRVIIQSRVYLTGEVEPVPQYDYNYSYPITVYEAVRRTMDDGATTLMDEIDAIYRLIGDKQNKVQPGVAGNLMTWSGMNGQIGSTEVVKAINSDPASRSNQKIPTERAVGDLVDTKVNQASFNKHVENANIHITDIERTRWNAMAPLSSLNAHIGNTSLHITEAERGKWNKSATQDDLETHVYDTNNPHNVTAHQVGTYTRNEIDNMFNTIRDTFFVYMNIYWDERTNIAKLTDYEPTNWNPNYVLAYGDELPEVDDPSLTYFALKPATDTVTEESQDCIIYCKRPGLPWTEVGFHTMQPGTMVIQYPNTRMYVWIAGHFLQLFTDSSIANGDVTVGGGSGSVAESNLLWRPIVTEEGYLTWVKSSSDTAPTPILIKGRDGITPVKGVDYDDGKDGVGVPVGGQRGEILVKLTDDNYETTWKGFLDLINDLALTGGKLPAGLVDWDAINNKPNMYDSLGDNNDGFMTQSSITRQFSTVANQIQELESKINNSSDSSDTRSKLLEHLYDFNNPHRITPEKISAVPLQTYLEHVQNYNNPHNVTKEALMLGNVDNTADRDKPISSATQNALDEINRRLNAIANSGGTGSGSTGSTITGPYVSNVSWNKTTATITFTYGDASQLNIEIPIKEVFQTLYFDEYTKELVFIMPDGTESRANIGTLIKKYTGSVSSNIQVSVDENQTIKATLVPNSITGLELISSIALRGSPTTVTQPNTDKSTRIATTEFVRNQIIDSLISYETDRGLSANMGRILNTRKVDYEDVIALIEDIEGLETIDDLNSTDPSAALSANMGRYLDLIKAPRVHTSPDPATYGKGTISLFGHAKASDDFPLMDGDVSKGTDNGIYARGDHRHGTDITRAPIHWPDVTHGQYSFTGEPRSTLPPDSSNDDRIATTQWIRRNGAGVNFGISLTASTEPNKVVTLRSSFMDPPVFFLLQIGSCVAVTFANTDTGHFKLNDETTYTTLDVEGSGGYPILYGGRYLKNGQIGEAYTHIFVFDGNYWHLLNPVDTYWWKSTDRQPDVKPGENENVETYKITFNANGGQCNTTVANTNISGRLTSFPTPVRSGYDFLGWFTAKEGGTMITVLTVFTEDTTVYAQWKVAGGTVTPPGPDVPGPGEHTHVDSDWDGKCDVCGEPMEKGHNHEHYDDNGDGKCDDCGIEVLPWLNHKHVDADGDGYCDLCGERTGTFDNHTHVDNNGNGHCDDCGTEVLPWLNHEHHDDNGDGFCDDCGEKIGKWENHEHFDDDGDGHCDCCGETVPPWFRHHHVDNDGDSRCDNCGEQVDRWFNHKHHDENGDGQCDQCGEYMPDWNGHVHVDEDFDGRCDECGMEVKPGLNHKHHDDTGNGKCDHCDTDIPTWHNHTHVDNNGDSRCDKCGQTVEKWLNHTHVDSNNDGYCDRCGESMGGSTPPSGHQHVDDNFDGQCDICGEHCETGENHTHIDNDWNGKCDKCGKSVTPGLNHTHQDNDWDGKCDHCHEQVQPGTNANTPDPSGGQDIYLSTGYMGITIQGDGYIDGNGTVNYCQINIPHADYDNGVRIEISKGNNDFAILMGDGTIIPVYDPEIISTNKFGTIVTFKMTDRYTMGTACKLFYTSTNGYIRIIPLDEAGSEIYTYVIKFDANGGIVAPSTMRTNTEGFLSSLPMPTYTGHKFYGWWTSPVGGIQVTQLYKFAAETTVYAHWEEHTHVDNNWDGKCDDCGEEVTRGTNATTPDPDDDIAPEDKIYTTTGYLGITAIGPGSMNNNGEVKYVQINIPYLDSSKEHRVEVSQGRNDFAVIMGDGTTYRIFNPTPVSNSKWGATYLFEMEDYYPAGSACKLYYSNANAYIQIIDIDAGGTENNSVTITFDANGGSCNTKTLSTNKDGYLTSLPSATYGFNKFLGWFTTRTGGSKITTTYKFAAPVTVYAHWDMHQHVDNDWDGLCDECQEVVTPGTNATTPKPSEPEPDVPTIRKFNVSYYDRGVLAHRDYYVEEGTDYVVKNYTSGSNDGYELKGWDTKVAATNVVYQENSKISIRDNVILYAVWLEIYKPDPGPTDPPVDPDPDNPTVDPGKAITITFNATGGLVFPETKTAYSNIALGADFIPPCIRDNYTLLGWYTEQIYGGVKVDASTKFTKNTTLYARWEKTDKGTNVNKYAGYTGATFAGDGSVDKNGDVNHVYINITYESRPDGVKVIISSGDDDFTVQMSNGTRYRVYAPKVLSMSKWGTMVQFQMEDYYGIGSPVQLFYNNSTAYIKIIDLDSDGNPVEDFYEPAPAVATGLLDEGTVDVPYTAKLTANGDDPFVWLLTDGALPNGLSMDRNGNITGTPTTAGKFSFTVKVMNNSGSAQGSMSITINHPDGDYVDG